MIIDSRETATQTRPTEYYPSARAAFYDYLVRTKARSRGAVLLPAYIGWSAREGSGVFDPIARAGCECRFYRMTKQLIIDVDDVVRQLQSGSIGVLVLIHYFGWPDPSTARLVEVAESYNVRVVEDEAHALLTDMVGGAAGRLGEAVLYSLHKLLPVPDGGVLRWKGASVGTPGTECRTDAGVLTQFDLSVMSRSRLTNASLLRELLLPLAGRVDSLFGIDPGIVPQTWPVIIRKSNRDALYHAMNASGYGVVSLYHTMITQISSEQFPDSHWLARRIMNLPIHPSASKDGLFTMVARLDELTHE